LAKKVAEDKSDKAGTVVTKSELVARVAARVDQVTKKDVAKSLDAILDTITAALARHESVAIVGFGTFGVTHRAERTGVNPQNPSKKIKIAARDVPVFKAGRPLKEAVAAGK